VERAKWQFQSARTSPQPGANGLFWRLPLHYFFPEAACRQKSFAIFSTQVPTTVNWNASFIIMLCWCLKQFCFPARKVRVAFFLSLSAHNEYLFWREREWADACWGSGISGWIVNNDRRYLCARAFWEGLQRIIQFYGVKRPISVYEAALKNSFPWKRKNVDCSHGFVLEWFWKLSAICAISSYKKCGNIAESARCCALWVTQKTKVQKTYYIILA
jgi:hypothetical protein